ncbi:MAG: hypothetical protein AAGC64_13235 [Bacteroidota bacterium]
MRQIFTWLLINFVIGNCLSQITFEPPEKPLKIQAIKASRTINIDGKLDEASWLKPSTKTEGFNNTFIYL